MIRQNALKVCALAGMLIGSAAPSSAAFSFFNTFFDTDWTSVGIGGMRGSGTETLTLTGVSGTVTGAYLFWHGPTDSSDPLANAVATFNSTTITGTNIGISQDNNWGFANSQAYRADVTSLVTGNGDYELSDFTKPGFIDVNGASLFVLFDDADSTNNRDLVLFNGNDSNVSSAFDPQGWDVSLSGINYTSGTASIQLTVSDGQDFGNDEGISLNGGNLIPTGPNWQGELGVDIVGNGSLWDQKSFDVTSFLSPGLNNLHLTTGAPVSDALSLIVAAIDLPAGAAPPIDPPPPMTPVPEAASFGLVAVLGLFATAALRRRPRAGGIQAVA